jgi:hypothetical protein
MSLSFSYKDLVFEPNRTDKYMRKEKVDIYQEWEDNLHEYMMELYILPEGVNLRCNDVKRFVISEPNSKFVYFPLSREFDIFFSVKSITNAEHILKLELCYADGLEKIKDLEFNIDIDICIPLYIYKCIKIEYDDVENIPVKVEMIYSAGLLKHKYKNIIANITNIIFP